LQLRDQQCECAINSKRGGDSIGLPASGKEVVNSGPEDLIYGAVTMPQIMEFQCNF